MDWASTICKVHKKRGIVAKGYDVVGGQVPDGSGWAGWKNRTDLVLTTLFPME